MKAPNRLLAARFHGWVMPEFFAASGPILQRRRSETSAT
jgi:hypothetical protein